MTKIQKSIVLVIAALSFGFAPILFGKRVKSLGGFLGFFLLFVLFLEMMQFLTFRGMMGVDDVILNTIGALGGYMLMKTAFMKKILIKLLDLN